MTQLPSRAAAVCVVAVSALSLSGCLASKLRTVHRQACAFDQNFALTVNDGVSLTLFNPVLQHDDVAVLAGIAPDMKRRIGNTYQASYTLRKAGDTEVFDVPVDIQFQKRDGNLLLTKVSAESPLLALLHPAELPQLIDCSTRLPVLGTHIEIPIPDFDRAVLPTRNQLIKLGGPPAAQNRNGTVLDYNFVIIGESEERRPGTITLTYDESGRRLQRTRTQYHHYVLTTDFEQGTAWLRVTLDRFEVSK